MSKTCGECTYLNIDPGKGDLYGKFPCEKKWEYHLATDTECDRFCTAYNRDYSSIKNAWNYSNEHSSSGGCYLTTMLCNILKMPDNNVYLETMRKFRKDVLQKEEKYSSILVEYDIIGPKIANALNNDSQKELIAQKYFDSYIPAIIYNIHNKNYDNAVFIYKTMTNLLKSFYGLGNINVTTLEIENADIKESGHGIYKVKKITPNV